MDPRINDRCPPTFPPRSAALKAEAKAAPRYVRQSFTTPTQNGDLVTVWRNGEVWKQRPDGSCVRMRDVEAVKE